MDPIRPPPPDKPIRRPPPTITEPLSYCVLDPRASDSRSKSLVSEAYGCWHQVWTETFSELDGITQVYADDFTRQDELGALFHGRTCIGVSGFRWVDLKLRHFREDSYFRVWPEDARQSAIAEGSWVCIGSNISVLRDWRRGARGVPVKDLLLSLAVLRFLDSGADVMIGTMRNNRAMNALAYRLGARALRVGLSHHGVAVDLVAFQRPSASIEALDPALYAIVESLWTRSKNQESYYEIGALPVREEAG